MEYLDLFDINGKNLNKTILRGDKNFLDGEYIKICTVWIKNNDKFLIQKTSKEKGSDYAVSGGHVPSGTTPITQAVVELREELGIIISETDLNYIGREVIGHVIFEVYLLEYEKILEQKFELQKEEVENINWLTKPEIELLSNERLIRKSTLIQYNNIIKNIF